MAAEVITVPFGVGELYLTTNATPGQSIYVGGLQELALKITRTTKGFKGAYLFDLLKAITGAEAVLTAKYGAFKPTLIASVLGGTVAAGYRALVKDELMGAAALTYAVAHPTGMQDKGACDATGTPLTRVASAPAAGQYSVVEATGVYTFASSAVYSVSYTWDASTTLGQKVDIVNSLMAAPTSWYQIDAFNPAEKTGFVFNKALPKSLNLPRKNDDFLVEDLEFDLIPDSTGKLGTVYLGV